MPSVRFASRNHADQSRGMSITNSKGLVGVGSTASEPHLPQLLDNQAVIIRSMTDYAQDLVLTWGSWFVAATDLHPDTTYSGPAIQARVTRHMVYCEGYYLAHDKVHLGAWCATTTGEIHYGPAANAYLGMGMSETFRRATTARTGSAGVLIAQPQDNFRLLRAGIPPGAALDAGYRHTRTIH